MAPRVSVIISNRNDITMLVVTLRSILEELRPLGPGGGEVVIADNSDKDVRQILKGAIPSGYIKDGVLKVVYQDFPCLFSARELAAQTASGDYLICLDSHMIVGRDAILDLVSFMDRRSDDPTMGFAHAPICWAHHHERTSKHDRDLSRNELGPWGGAYKDERTITWKGIPWICRREWFLDRDKGLNGYGALAKHHVSWGGGDMHIGVKPWLLGFKNWAVPTNACIHIGPFPRLDQDKNPNSTIISKAAKDDTRYRLYAVSGEFPHTFGFLVSCYVLGGEPMMKRNLSVLTERFGQYLNAPKWWSKAIEIGKDEKAWLDQRKVISFEQFIATKPWEQGQPNLQTLAVENKRSPLLTSPAMA